MKRNRPKLTMQGRNLSPTGKQSNNVQRRKSSLFVYFSISERQTRKAPTGEITITRIARMYHAKSNILSMHCTRRRMCSKITVLFLKEKKRVSITWISDYIMLLSRIKMAPSEVKVDDQTSSSSTDGLGDATHFPSVSMFTRFRFSPVSQIAGQSSNEGRRHHRKLYFFGNDKNSSVALNFVVHDANETQTFPKTFIG